MYEYALSKGTVLQGGKYPYRIEDVLGQGNYGITYKVSAEVSIGNITNKIYFAVKENFTKKYCSRKADGVTMRFPAEFASDVERDLEDFLTEGKRLNEICKSSKHIVKVNETWQENETAYYAMEFIDGGSLSDYVISKGRLSEKEALKIFMPILEAVNSVHQYRLLHLDIKPENIMLERQNGGELTPILIDFGITLHFDQSGTITKTSKDHSIGCSDGFAPMEQYTTIDSFAPTLDVYALGATLYYLLKGKNPPKAFDIESTAAIRESLPSSVSEKTKNAIVGAMEKSKFERTQSVGLFLSALCDNESVIVTGEPVKPTKTTKFASKDSKKPDKKKLVGVVIAVIIILGIILLSIRNNQTKRDKSYVDEDSIVWVEDTVAVDTCVADSFPELTPITRNDEQDKGYKEQNKKSNKNSSDQGTVQIKFH